MPKARDLTGETFGRLHVDEFAGRINKERYYYCTCECGSETLTKSKNLSGGKTLSCGCLKDGSQNLVHGKARKGNVSQEYKSWQHLLAEAHCESWNEFLNFYTDLGDRPSPNYQLARHDVRQPHSKENTYYKNPNERIERKNLMPASELFIDVDALVKRCAAAAA